MTHFNEPAYAPILEDQYTILVDPAPCDECDKFDVCATQRKACQVFFHWAHSGVLVSQPLTGYPNKRYYDLLFPSEGEDSDGERALWDIQAQYGRGRDTS